MICVYTADSVVDAQLVCDALIDEGLDAQVQGGYLSGAIGELPPGQLLTVWITDDTQQDRARQIVERFELTFVSGKETGGPSRACPGCDEQLESQFSHCWRCGHSLIE